jgi:hypothetical protein
MPLSNRQRSHVRGFCPILVLDVCGRIEVCGLFLGANYDKRVFRDVPQTRITLFVFIRSPLSADFEDSGSSSSASPSASTSDASSSSSEPASIDDSESITE